MPELPTDVQRSLLRAMSAFMKATPAQELPPKLRPIRSFAVKALGPHRKTLLAALDDDALRPRVVEWLDQKQHPLSRSDADHLRTAAERADGWEERLSGEPPGVAPSCPDRTGDDKAAAEKALEREKEKARKARDEAKRARDEAALTVGREKAKADALAVELKGLRSSLQDAEARAKEAERRATKAAADAERLERKHRKEIEGLSRTIEKLRKEAKESRRSLRYAEERLRNVDKPKAPAAAPRKTRSGPRGPRKPLPFVKGLTAEDPRTLEGWLAAKNLHVLVDGYNVTKSKGGFGNLELPKQRQRLVDELNSLARKHGVKVRVIFDGSHVPPGSARLAKGPAVVEYSRPDEIADDHLIAVLEELPAYPVLVVTDDKELRERASKHGATIAGSKQLLSLIR
jgi:predicted RNA-binding protein with PIN domain